MGPLLEFYLQGEFGQEGKVFAVNIDGHMTEFVEDEVSHAEVDKGVTAALVLDHAPSQEEGVT